jgi:putative tryptophan/tyrosine transport system substrate-binding protein
MRRRDFITLLGGAAAAWPLAARAQTLKRVVVVVNRPPSDPQTQTSIAAFKRRLAELGWVERRTIQLELRFTNVDVTRAVAAEVVSLAPDVIVAQNTPTVAALRKLTTTIPIVFEGVSDPVGDGFIESLARPGGNASGFTNTMASLGGKWLELLREAAPQVKRVGLLFYRAASPGAGTFYRPPFEAAAAALSVTPVPLELHHENDIEPLIANFAASGGDGLVSESNSFLATHRGRIIAASNSHRLPAMYASAVYAQDGGLIAYGTDVTTQWVGAAGYVDRILLGAKPGDLPTQQPAKFELVINLKTAKMIGLTVPPALLATADEVIE